MGRAEGKKKGNVNFFFTKRSEVNRVSLTSILVKNVKSVCHLSETCFGVQMRMLCQSGKYSLP